MAAGRFPTDEPLNTVGHRQADASIDLGIEAVRRTRLRDGPEKRTRQTAELLGLHATVENRLADLDAAGGAATWSVACAPMIWPSG